MDHLKKTSTKPKQKSETVMPMIANKPKIVSIDNDDGFQGLVMVNL